MALLNSLNRAATFAYWIVTIHLLYLLLLILYHQVFIKTTNTTEFYHQALLHKFYHLYNVDNIQVVFIK